MGGGARKKSAGTARQGLWYLFAGGSAAALELLLFQFLFVFVGLSIECSNIVAVVVATCLNFAINGVVTFEGSRNPLWSAFKYLLLFGFNTTFSTVTTACLVDLGWPSIFAKLLTMTCIVLWNFVLYRKVVFS